MRQLPIPTPSAGDRAALEGLVSQILAVKQGEVQADVSNLEREIDERVYRLYGLTKEEVAIMEGVG